MLENILRDERSLFFLINHSHTGFLDSLMWSVSHIQVWIPLFVSFLFLLIYKRKYTEWLPVIVFIILVFVCCDQVSSHITKPLFARFRPTYHPDFMNEVMTLRGYKGGGLYGFISGHSTNAFGFATLTALLFRNKLYSFVIYTFAFLIAYSRIYLGVHFISDVYSGIIAGTAIGAILYFIYRAYIKKYHGTVNTISPHRIKIIAIIVASYIPIILLYSVLSAQWIK